MKRSALLALSLLLLACFGPACSDDDGPTGVAPLDTTQGVSFCGENAATVAGAVVNSLDVFPDLNGVYLLARMAVDGYAFPGGLTQPAEGYDLGSLGLCQTGTASARWRDADDSQTLTAGDSVTLELDECDGSVSGILALAVASVSPELTELGIAFDIDFVETFRDTFEVETWRGDFAMEVAQISEPTAQIVITHKVVDPADGDAGLTITLDGENVAQMGCFDLRYAIDLATGGFVLDEPYAVFRVPGCGVMTMDSEGLCAFESPSGQIPARGQTRLSPGAGVTPCTGLDVSGSGVATNPSTLALTVVNGGAVTLTGRDCDGAFFLVNTFWGDLD